MVNFFMNRNFTKRNYDCTTIVACEVVGPTKSFNAKNFRPATELDQGLLDKVSSLYIQDNIRYLGYL